MTIRLPVLLLAMMVLLEWPLQGLSRIAGFYRDSQFLTDNTVGDAGFAVLTVAGLIICGLKLRGIALARGVFVVLAAAFLLGLQVYRAPLSPQVASPWTTPMVELIRAVIILSFYVFATILPFRIDRLPPRGIVAIGWVLIASGFLSLVIVYGQSAGVLPNFYFQWYGREHLLRPTGGFVHPHFYAYVNNLSLIAVALLANSRRIGRGAATILLLVLFSGTIVSTSRIGAITGVVTLAFCFFFITRIRASTLTLAFGGGLAVAATVAIAVVISGAHDGAISHFADVFFSFLSSDDITRGRQERWAEEISFIFADDSTVLFGYGYQPFVSHNYVLRLLQVYGFVGTAVFIGLLTTMLFMYRPLKSSPFRSVWMIAVLQTFIASLSFPVLISLASNATLVLVLVLTLAADNQVVSIDDEETEAEPLFSPARGTKYGPRVA